MTRLMDIINLACGVSCLVGIIITMGVLATQGHAGAMKGDDDA